MFWFDPIALQAIAESKEELSMLAQISSLSANNDEKVEYPLKPPVESVAEFKTTPAIHAGYATTWFGLSGAGLYMTKKLITRGRG